MLWGIVACVAALSVLNDYRVKKKKAEMYEIATNYYVINGINYLSYSQLKYIATTVPLKWTNRSLK